ncbi:efflux RND transporter permease subunit [Candidatus Margulisiibacteriota bacterium]
MILTNLAIKKSLTVFVLIGLIVILGFISYSSMPREAAPEIQIPYIIVKTLYFGVSPADIEPLVTNPIEKQLKKLKDVEAITSTSGDSFSAITIEFKTNVDIDEALRKVKERVDEAKIDLPDEAEDPEVIEINLSDLPIMSVNISGDYGLIKLKEVAENLKDRFETVNGVLNVTLAGGLEREIQINVLPEKLKKYGLALNQITQAVKAENINIPGGDLDLGKASFLVRVPGEFTDPQEIKDLIIDDPDDQLIYLRDIANIEDGYKEEESFSRFNKKDSVSLSIQKRSGENVIRVAEAIKEIIEEAKPKLPATTRISVIADQSTEISDLVDELENSIILGLTLVVLVLFLFMGKRNSVFVGIAIPLSMLVSFIVLNALDITLNMVLLFGLILSLGMLVDNAIVIVENIYRFIEEGMPRAEAAKKATAEVAWPVIASTATTIAVFFPLFNMPGVAGKFMRFLPISVTTTITASLFVAMIINPVICANLMVRKNKLTKIKVRYKKFQDIYRKVLEKALANRRKVLLLTVASFISIVMLFFITNPGYEFFPQVTPREVYINVATPEDSTLENTNDVVMQIEKLLWNHPNIKLFIATVGTGSSQGMLIKAATQPNIARITVEFKDKEKQSENPNATIKWLREKLILIPGADIEITQQSMGPPSGAAIGIKIAGDDYSLLSKYAEKIKNILRKTEGIVDIKDDYIKGKPEIIVKINREKAALLEVNTSLIASTIRTAIHGSTISVFREENDEYDIKLTFQKDEQNNSNLLDELIIAGPKNAQIPLSELADIYTDIGMGSIQHLDSERVVTVEGSPKKGFLAERLIRDLTVELKDFPLDEGYSIAFTGENKHRDIMAGYLKKSFIIAIFLIALILVTQFNSITLPFIILCSVFLSTMGVLLGLIIFRRPFGIMMTGIGIISLAGVIVNNAIVLIDYIRQLRHSGMEKIAAVIQAGSVRLRPVLLTAITTILGLVPMTFGININFKLFYNNLFSQNIFKTLSQTFVFGSQSTEFWGSMGSAVTIGLAVGTILTLVVVPVLYVSFDNVSSRLFVKIKALNDEKL